MFSFSARDLDGNLVPANINKYLQSPRVTRLMSQQGYNAVRAGKRVVKNTSGVEILCWCLYGPESDKPIYALIENVEVKLNEHPFEELLLPIQEKVE
jgi:hypothetical protein